MINTSGAYDFYINHINILFWYYLDKNTLKTFLIPSQKRLIRYQSKNIFDFIIHNKVVLKQHFSTSLLKHIYINLAGYILILTSSLCVHVYHVHVWYMYWYHTETLDIIYLFHWYQFWYMFWYALYGIKLVSWYHFFKFSCSGISGINVGVVVIS